MLLPDHSDNLWEILLSHLLQPLIQFLVKNLNIFRIMLIVREHRTLSPSIIAMNSISQRPIRYFNLSAMNLKNLTFKDKIAFSQKCRYFQKVQILE